MRPFAVTTAATQYQVYVYLGCYQCHSWPYSPVHACFHVCVITFYVYVFMAENKDGDDNKLVTIASQFGRGDDVDEPLLQT